MEQSADQKAPYKSGGARLPPPDDFLVPFHITSLDGVLKGFLLGHGWDGKLYKNNYINNLVIKSLSQKILFYLE